MARTDKLWGKTKATYCKSLKCVEKESELWVYTVLSGVKIGDIEILDRTCTDFNRSFDPKKRDIRLIKRYVFVYFCLISECCLGPTPRVADRGGI